MNDRETASLEEELIRLQESHNALLKTVTDIGETLLRHINEANRVAQARIEELTNDS